MPDDFRVRVGMPRHWKVAKLYRLVGLESDPFRCLMTLWAWAACNKPDGVLGQLDDDDLAAISGLAENAGGCDAHAWRNALECAGFIDVADGIICLHDWREHQPWLVGAEARSQAASIAAKARWEPKLMRGASTRKATRKAAQCPSPSPNPSPNPNPSLPTPLPPEGGITQPDDDKPESAKVIGAFVGYWNNRANAYPGRFRLIHTQPKPKSPRGALILAFVQAAGTDARLMRASIDAAMIESGQWAPERGAVLACDWFLRAKNREKHIDLGRDALNGAAIA